MWMYHIILIVCFLSAVFMERRNMAMIGVLSQEERIECSHKIEKKLFVILTIYMICLCGLRAYGKINHVGIDTYNYYHMYLEKEIWKFSDIFQQNVSDKGYFLLEWVLYTLKIDFWVLLFISAMLYVGVLAIYIYRYSKNRWMSIFIFVAMGLYTFAFSAIRQGIAMGICILAYMLMEKVKGVKGFLLFALLIWIASTIHASALIFFGAYFLQKIPFKPVTVFIFLGISTVTMLFKNQFANLILQLAAETSEKYESYEVVQNGGAGIMLYLFVLMTVVLRLLASGSMNEVAKKDNSVYLLLCMLILFPATQTGGAMMRIYYYYYMFIVVYLPNVLESIDDFKTKQFGYLLLSLFLLWFYLSGDKVELDLVPYYFFWQV